MTELKERIAAFTELGKRIDNLDAETATELFAKARSNNSWFTRESVESALKGIVNYLHEDKLTRWAEAYPVRNQNKKVGIVMAGNIPLVGFHDLLSVIISGNQAHIKLSSQDTALMTYVVHELINISPALEKQIIIRDQLKDIDAIIATGSDNTSRYFNYYFGKYPNIIRKNRTSCAVLTGSESDEDLARLGDDIFLYFGLGCRNVAKLYVPKGYKFDQFYAAIEPFKYVSDHHKYNNNYDYNKSIYLVNGVPHLDNGFLMLKEDNAMVSPISVIFYEQYASESELEALLEANKEKIQCVVTNNNKRPDSVNFGDAQQPEVWDYADGVDTMKFLVTL
ncbi:acyl-CoA reductase [Fulvivirga kasyanovii]|uniref:Acyl-CoA reductase n=1 Tax=Fulvivirga kasyanovii TaxID=396812 RepID=A0ABW9RK91_9BACT|nr:acyl-CoA reductase [Fulvivirga kasyanovii]MTI24381.1 acyl-CoA reductase [Fulvivirga kasyanovii]